MTLQAYMKKYKLSLRKMAGKTGIDHRVIHRYIQGKCLPSLPNAYLIYKATSRRVGLRDWFL